MELPDSINPSKQRVSLENLKAELLKIKIPITENMHPQKISAYNELNNFMEKKVNNFCEQVLKKIYLQNDFNPNKVGWYFEIYKEGLETKKVKNNLISKPSQQDIENLSNYFKGKTITDFCEESSSFLSECFVLFSSWYREELLQNRIEKIYNDNDPIQWIKNVENENNTDKNEMLKTIQQINPLVHSVLDIIQLLKSKKI